MAGRFGSMLVKTQNPRPLASVFVFALLLLAGSLLSAFQVRAQTPLTLIDIDFGGGTSTSETGFAVTGQTSTDFWNFSGGGTVNLEYADGSPSSTTVTLAYFTATNGTGAADPMYNSYVYTTTGDILVTLKSVSPGTYDFYVYGHGSADNQNSTYVLNVGGQVVGSLTTLNGPGWNSSAVWQPGLQYVEFSNVVVTNYQIVTITVAPAASEYAVIAGMQIARMPLTGPPVVISQPASHGAAIGANVSFNVVASGPLPLSYQWQFGGSNIVGATGSTLNVTNVQAGNAGDYSVTISNAYGSTESSNAVLIVVTQAPLSLIDIDFGGGTSTSEVGFDVTGQTTNDFWNFCGGGTVNLELASGTPSGTSVIVANNFGTWGTGAADPMYNAYLYAYTNMNVSLTNLAGGAYNFYIYGHGAADNQNSAYRLSVGGQSYGSLTNLNGPGWNTSAWQLGLQYVEFSNVVVGAGQGVIVVVSPGVGGYAIIAGMQIAQVGALPVINSQPVSQTAGVGANVSFNVVASGSLPLSYQWEFNNGNLTGATTSVLVVSNVQAANQGDYSVVVSNLYGLVTSSNASLGVNLTGCAPPPSGIVSWWPGNGNTDDLVGGNNGTLQGGTYVAGEVGQAFCFNGNGERVSVGNPTNLQLQNFTIEGWIQRANTNQASLSSGGGLIFGYGSGGYALGLADNGQLFISKVAVSGVFAGSVTDTNWHHVAVTTSGGNLVFYVDGLAYPAGTYAPGYTFGTSAAVGARGDNFSSSFFGNIDEISVYNRPLMAAEIQAIYNAGSAGKCVSSPPAITAEPAGQTVTPDSTVTISVAAAGTPPLSYQWQFNGSNLSGATNSTLSLTNVQQTNSGVYSVAVTNFLGSVTSSNAALSVQASPFFISQPVSQSAGMGTTVTFSAIVDGVPPFSFQWELNGTNINGATNSTLSLSNVQTTNDGAYSLVVTNIYGSVTSSNATLTVGVPPSIATQPTNQYASAGDNAIFTVAAAGDQPLSYQWQLNNVNISGATTTTLELDNVQMTNEGDYSVVVSSPYGSVTSSNALLGVDSAGCTPPPAGLVSWWPGDGNTDDLAGGNSGTLGLGVTYVAGEVGQAFSFNGNGAVNVGNPTGLQLQNFTIDAWVQRGSNPSDELIFSYGSGGYGFGMNTAGLLFLSQIGTSHVYASVFINDRSWHHLAVTTSSGNVVFYIDGVAYPAGTYNPGYTFGSSAAIGARGDINASGFWGNIDEVAIYNRALAASEIQAIFQAGSAGKCAFSPPVFNTQPTNESGVSGQNVTFSVLAEGSAPLSYQWEFDGTAVSGGTNSALTLTKVQPANAGNYSVTVSNSFGSVTSTNATLVVHIPPSITTQPSGQTALAGGNAAFVVVATGDPPLSYQWRFNNVGISGATTSALAITNVQPSNDGSYSVLISSPYGSVVSSSATLSVNAAGCAPPPAGLLSWWPGNGNAVDLAGGNSGALVGGVAYVAGEAGQAFSFNGNGEAVSVGFAGSLRLQSFTIEGWIQRGTTNQASLQSGGGYIFAWGPRGYGFGLADNGQMFLSQIGISQVLSSVSITDTNWHHVAVATANSNVVFYVDGMAYPAGVYGPGYNYADYGAAIGARGDTHGNSFLGNIDELAVYNRALTVIEIQSICNAGSSGKCGFSPPVITSQPANQFGVAGSNVTIGFTVAGTGPLWYQWQFNGVNLSLATNPVLTLVNVRSNNVGFYAVTVSNAYGVATSSNATLTLGYPPSITMQPMSQTAPAGASATFNVAASGDQPLSYQWLFNGTNISGATAASLTLSNVQPTSEGNYSVLVFNPYASVTSSNAALSVNLAGCEPPPGGLVSWWPGNGNANDLVGGNNGTWKSNATYVPGNVGPAFGFNGATGGGVGVGNPTNLQLQNFTIEGWIQRTSTNHASLSSGGGLIFSYGSGGYGLGLADNGQIFITRVGVSGVLVGSITDTNWHHVAVTTSGGNLVFYVDGLAYPAGTYAPGYTFGTSAAIGARGDNYASCFLGNIDEVSVYNRALTATEIQAIYDAGSAGKCGVGGSPPSITSQPTNQNMEAGGTAQFSVVAAGSSPLAYQWQFNGKSLTDMGNISGSATPTLTVSNVISADAGVYTLTVTNAYGSATSSNAVLTFIPTYPLSVTTAGGGTVSANPSLAQYLPNSAVTLTAAPDNGWFFLDWLGDAQGTNSSINVTMNSPKKVMARFGAALSTTAYGGGTVLVIPSMALYPYGQSVCLVAQPQSGNFFVQWTNSVVGSDNPMTLTIQSNGITAGAIFAPLGGDSFSLTVVPMGYGQVSTVPAGVNVFADGQTVTLTATPNDGQAFLGWTGTASGTDNPFVVTMNQNEVITANFSLRPLLTIQPTSDYNGVLLTITGGATNVYGIQGSSDLLNWVTIQTVTNANGEAQLTDQFQSNTFHFYRAVSQ
jgi:hypothetical protein